MKVDAIRLFNFMPFEDTGWMELRPITLLFGRNSSGKSAIIRALLLLKQSLDAPNEDGPLQFVSTDGLVDAGDFQTAVHRHETDRSIIFGFRCNLAGDTALDILKTFVKNNTIREISDAETEHLTYIELFIGFGQYEGRVQPNLIDLRTVVGDTQIILLECKRVDDPETRHTYIVNSDVAQMPDLPEESIEVCLRDSRGFWTTFARSIPDSLRKIDELLYSVQQGVEEFLRNIVHLGSIRPAPERVYVLRNTDRSQYEREGLAGWYAFLRDQINQEQAAVIAQWMQLLGLGDAVGVEVDRDEQPVARSRVWFHSNPRINIRDVGFGAAQVLPVVATAVLAQPGSLVIIEQPELHLHTSAQVELGSFFIEIAKTQKRSKNESKEQPNVRFLLETHSEYMLLRFRRRVAKDRLEEKKYQKPREDIFAAEDIKILFIPKTGVIETINLNEDGKADKPSKYFQDFFIQDYSEVSEIIKSLAELRSYEQELPDSRHEHTY